MTQDKTSKRHSDSDPEKGRIYLDQLFDNAQVGIVMCENDGTVIRVNPEFSRIFGYSFTECLGQNIDSLVTTGKELSSAEGITRSVARGENHSCEAERISKDGRVKQVVIMASPILINGRQEAVYAFYRDITHERQMASELLKARKLEAVGTLAGGIAHDFNNLLSIIMGNIDLGMIGTPAGSAAGKALDIARDACMEAHNLTQKFLTFSSGGHPMKRDIDLKALLKAVSKRCFEETDTKVSLKIADDLPRISADPTQIQYVFETIMENARESIKQDGKVMVDAGVLEAEAVNANPFLYDEMTYLIVKITDNGVGIPKADLQKVFDPYFSTKETVYSKGLGMGLSIAHSIVGQHNGHIDIESEYKKSTTVGVYLPVPDTM